MAAQDQDPRNLVQLAVDIHTDLGKLAVGLAHAGAPPQAVATLQHMGGIVGDLVKSLGAGPVGAAPGQPEPGAPQAAAPQQPQQVPVQPAGVTPGERPNGLHQATVHLARAAQATAQAAARK